MFFFLSSSASTSGKPVYLETIGSVSSGVKTDSMSTRDMVDFTNAANVCESLLFGLVAKISFKRVEEFPVNAGGLT